MTTPGVLSASFCCRFHHIIRVYTSYQYWHHHMRQAPLVTARRNIYSQHNINHVRFYVLYTNINNMLDEVSLTSHLQLDEICEAFGPPAPVTSSFRPRLVKCAYNGKARWILIMSTKLCIPMKRSSTYL